LSRKQTADFNFSGEVIVMWTTKEIWEAGKAALAAKGAPAPAPPSPVVESVLLPADFDPAAFGFEARIYRVRFKNGNSGEYEGSVLAARFPFDPREIERVEPVEEVGQGL
jgi:hypothetical protein